MRVRLKGLNSVHKRLADGTRKTYWYAWKGGPALPGKPGDPDFIAAFNHAVSQRIAPPQGVIFSLLQGYQSSQDFLLLRERTRRDYIRQIKIIEREFGDFPLKALNDERARGVFLTWRDGIALKSRRQADYAWVVLALILSWALGRGLIATNPCKRGGRLYNETRAEIIWTDADEAAFMKTAPEHLKIALILALWTGQRQGDLLRLPWSAYDGETIRLRQSKSLSPKRNRTGRRVTIPVGAPLKAALDVLPRRSTIVLTNSYGIPWTEHGFSSSWRKACKKAGVEGVTNNDLRGTAVTRLALAGCTEAEIATITGHSLHDVRSILDAHYLSRDPALAESAIKKLERRTQIPNCVPNRS